MDRYFAADFVPTRGPVCRPRRSLWDTSRSATAGIERENATHSGGLSRRPSTARLMLSDSSSRSSRRSFGAVGSIPAAPTSPWRCGQRRSCRCAGGSPRRPRRDLERYVLPRFFGAYRLGRLPAEEIEEWLNDEVAAGVAPSSVHRHYRTLRRMLAVAVEKQKIGHNVCDRVDWPRVPKREMVFLDWDQVVARRRRPHRTVPNPEYISPSTAGCAGRTRRVAPRLCRRSTDEGAGHRAARPARVS